MGGFFQQNANASDDAVSMVGSSGNTIVREETTQLQDDAKLIQGDSSEINAIGSGSVLASGSTQQGAGAFMVSDVGGPVNTGISTGGDYITGGVQIGHGSSYIAPEMNDNTYNLLNTAFNTLSANASRYADIAEQDAADISGGEVPDFVSSVGGAPPEGMQAAAESENQPVEQPTETKGGGKMAAVGLVVVCLFGLFLLGRKKK